MDPSNNELTDIWTHAFPEFDGQHGSADDSYRPGDKTILAETTRSVAAAVTKVGTSSTADALPPQSGGPFVLKEKIGEGGMGLIYRAAQPNLSRDVAIKSYQPAMGGAGSADQFLAEARVTAWLDHPNIVPAHHLQEFPSGEIQLAMKLVGGESWAQQLKRLKPWEAETIPEDQFEILLQVCNAIAFAHSKGIAHLDLKPDNIMVGEFGEVLVLDWGLAVDFFEQKEDENNQRAPHKSTVIHPSGTPRYMAPELAVGKGTDIGPWTDCYLLGGILIKILTGHPPNKGDTLIQALHSALWGPMQELPVWVPDELKTIIARSQMKEPKERYATVNEFQNDLRAFLTHRQSLLLSKQAEEQLEQAAETHRGEKVYQHFSDAFSGFEQALKLWTKNGTASAGRDKAITGTLKHALVMGDLGLARSNLARLSKDHPEAKSLAAQVAEAEESVAEDARLQESQRIRLKAALFALFVGLTVGIILITISQRSAVDALAEATKAQSEAERERARTATALDQVKAANTKTTQALEASKERLAESYLMAGRFHHEAKEFLRAQFFFSKSLMLRESNDAREGLVQTRLAQVDGWSQSYGSSSQIPVTILESNDAAVLVVFRTFDPKTFKITGFKIELYEPSPNPEAASQFPWRRFQFDISTQYNFSKKPVFPSNLAGHISIHNGKEWTLWDYRTGRRVAHKDQQESDLQGRSKPSLKYSFKDRKTIVIHGPNAAPREYQLTYDKERIAISGNQRFVAVGNQSGVSVIDVLNDKTHAVIAFPEHPLRKGLRDLIVSHDGRFIATVFASEGRLLVWNTKSKSIEHKSEYHARAFSFSKNKPLLFIASAHAFHVRQFGASKILREKALRGVAALRSSRNPKEMILIGSKIRTLSLGPTPKASPFEEQDAPKDIIDHPSESLRAKYYKDRIEVWDLDNTKIQATLKLNSASLLAALANNAEAERFQKEVLVNVQNRALSFSNLIFKRQSPVVIAHNSQFAILYNYRLQKIVGFIGWKGKNYALAISPNGRTIASSYRPKIKGQRSAIQLWDGANGQFIREWFYPKKRILTLAFSHDSESLFLSFNTASNIQVSNLKGEELSTLKNSAQDGPIENFFLLREGRFLLGHDLKGSIKIWDLQSGHRVANFQAHGQWLSLAISADEESLVTVANRDSLKIWDLQEILHILEAPGKELHESVKRRTHLNLDQVLKHTASK